MKVFSRPVAVMVIGLSLVAAAAGSAALVAHTGTSQPLASNRTTTAATRAPRAQQPVTITVGLHMVSAPDGVAFAGERVEVSVLGWEAGSIDDQQWPLEQVQLDFGDGTSQLVNGQCGTRAAPVASHAYQGSGQFQVRVAAARFCDPAGRPDLSEASQDLRVLPSAPASAWSWPRCSQDQVQISASVQHLQLVAWEMQFIVRNVSAADCHLYGYPGLQFVCPDRNLLRPGTVLRAPNNEGSTLPPHLIALAPGDVASFAVGYAIGGPPPSQGCTSPVDETEVFLPGSTTYSFIHITGDTEDAGIADTGEFTISTVVPGATPWT